MEGQDAISLGVYKEKGLPDERIEKKEENEIRTRTVIERGREREQGTSLHKNILLGRDSKEPFIYLIFDFRSFALCLNPRAKPNLFYPTLFTNIYWFGPTWIAQISLF